MNDVMEWLTLSFKLVAVSIMMDNFRPNLNTNITSLSKGLIQLYYRVGHLRVLLGIGTLFNPVRQRKDVHFSLDLNLGGVDFYAILHRLEDLC